VISESTNPLTSRDRFKTRTFRNVVVIGVLFILVVIVMSELISVLSPGESIPMLIGDAIALVGAYYLYIVWDKRPIRLSCPKCERIISSNTPWVCGFCGKENRNANEFPFVDKCCHCGAEPKEYR